MVSDVFQNIGKIIERDSKSTTYKYALLRGVISIIQENSPYISFTKERVHIPTGLLIEKWMIFYYPILESSTFIPQIHGKAKLAFEPQFSKIISAYNNMGGFSAFYNDLKNKGIPENIESDFIALANRLKNTITTMPMKYIGRSISDDYYSIFNYESIRPKRKSGSTVVDLEFLINNYGYFSIPEEYYEAFKVLGSFISGQDSILFKWAEFSVNASGRSLSIENVINEVLKNPITERDINESKKIYKTILQREGKVYYVWTGRSIRTYDIDHMIPFSIWKNNDLWNLLPSHSTTNNQKRDRIPSPNLIERRKDIILHYWKLINKNVPERFQKEIQIALLGNKPFQYWQETAISQLKSRCDYLISNRGFDEWNVK